MLEDRAYTDGRGRFTFSGLGANTYTLVIEDDEYMPVNQTVRITSVQQGGPVGVTLTLKPRGGPGGGQAAPAVDPLASLPGKVRKEFEAGVAAGEKGKAAEAIKHYKKVLESEPDFYPAYNNLGYQYLMQQNLPEAERAFQEALKRDQSNANSYFGLGNVYLMQQKFREAEKTLNEGLKRDSGSALGHYLLGTVYFQTNRFRQAENNLRAALSRDPNLSLAQMTLVNLYLQQQRDREALAELKLFVDRFPQHPMIGQAKEMMKKLEDWLQSQQAPQ